MKALSLLVLAGLLLGACASHGSSDSSGEAIRNLRSTQPSPSG